MGQCGPVDPCAPCREVYAKDPRYVPDEDKPGSFRIATDQDRRKRPARVTVRPVEGAFRLPEATGSRRQAKRRRRIKQRRRS